jgi:hypothetical protein
MRDVATFIISAASLALDPIALLGYVPAGVLIRKQGRAVALGVLWMLFLQLVVVRPWSRPSFGPEHLVHLFFALAFAALIPLCLHLLASRFRTRGQTTVLAIVRSRLGFRIERYWRIFLTLQLIGFATLTFISLTSRNWAVLPYTPEGSFGRHDPPTSPVLTPYLCLRYPSSEIQKWSYEDLRWRYQALWQPYYASYHPNRDIRWDFLDADYWTRGHQNWIMLLTLLGPLAITKCAAWIAAGNKTP